ncbi:MAG: hypothetical protein WKF97_09465 [Chitinophagaceae bacterium]
MSFEEFSASLTGHSPAEPIPAYLKALWYDAKQDWEKAHNIAQDLHDSTGSWIHAYLHRKEGDVGNAGYWYRKAGRPMPAYSLDREWEEMVKELLVV